MMNTKKSRFGAWKVLAALPVAALLMMVGCKPAANTEADTTAVDTSQSSSRGDGYAGEAADTVTFSVVENNPEFPGGEDALYKYLAENIRYPEQAKKEKVQGRVFVRFVVDKDGSVVKSEVLRGIGNGCDEEALRVVNAMPKWTPGKQRGKPVNVQYVIPVNFKLQ